MSTTSARRTVAALTLSTIAGAALVAASTTSSSAEPRDGGVAGVRQATEQFRDVAAAEAAGYVRASGCERLPGVGAMGVHYLHPGRASDSRLVPTQPEVLLYEPTPDGGLELVGVEYFVAEGAARTSHPSVLGRRLDGPMAGHHDGMPTHYDLHLWVWRDNPHGISAAWNPAVSCPHGS
jgi:hypothetical protein